MVKTKKKVQATHYIAFPNLQIFFRTPTFPNQRTVNLCFFFLQRAAIGRTEEDYSGFIAEKQKEIRHSSNRTKNIRWVLGAAY